MRPKRLLAVAAALLLVALAYGCDTLAPAPAGPRVVPGYILPSGPDAASSEIVAFEAYVARHKATLVGDDDQPANKLGDDDMPDGGPCHSAGPPVCRNIYGDVNYCKDVCGRGFWQMSELNVCVNARSGVAYSCDGTDGPDGRWTAIIDLFWWLKS
jgi:hypothetical protein